VMAPFQMDRMAGMTSMILPRRFDPEPPEAPLKAPD